MENKELAFFSRGHFGYASETSNVMDSVLFGANNVNFYVGDEYADVAPEAFEKLLAGGKENVINVTFKKYAPPALVSLQDKYPDNVRIAEASKTFTENMSRLFRRDVNVVMPAQGESYAVLANFVQDKDELTSASLNVTNELKQLFKKTL